MSPMEKAHTVSPSPVSHGTVNEGARGSLSLMRVPESFVNSAVFGIHRRRLVFHPMCTSSVTCSGKSIVESFLLSLTSLMSFVPSGVLAKSLKSFQSIVARNGAWSTLHSAHMFPSGARSFRLLLAYDSHCPAKEARLPHKPHCGFFVFSCGSAGRIALLRATRWLSPTISFVTTRTMGVVNKLLDKGTSKLNLADNKVLAS